tara:strand:+ start:13935 stop:14453 length:519 start_codon:yes stop_codon:yes gene_type:complete
MATEIERKYLPKNNGWEALVTGTKLITQGYLINTKKRSLRIRSEDNSRYILCYKSGSKGISVGEYELVLWVWLGNFLLWTCGSKTLAKVRHYVPYGNHIFEIDVFEGKLFGLIIIEVELEREDEEVLLPDWVGKGISLLSHYKNSVLLRKGLPKRWPQDLVDGQNLDHTTNL